MFFLTSLDARVLAWFHLLWNSVDVKLLCMVVALELMYFFLMKKIV